MANDYAGSADRLIARIIEDASEEAAQITKQADEELARLGMLLENDRFGVEAERAAKSSRAREDILERSRTNAELDSRKYALVKKRELVDEAFAEAEKLLCGLGGAERDSLIRSLLLSQCEGGETIAPAKADEARIGVLIADVNAELAKRGAAALRIGAAAPVEGGFIARSEGFEKNCSFEAILKDVRAKEESAVAAILFG